ncbi:carboxypeptidase-like regulatory domain-containing protein [Hymenobacter sp. J193]|uniref:carboxypeptidase-like regulatory domain-containing protein n=1 Tax=Hymenobacter sp. J193 TaxID=2898429 RepID=UPI0021518040|nr:carboxypeptidase-like regulatory domain-containing protein [Hymenobacter sp. J193]MCR5889687.1 carboxypeptidase-like regulatory domain-containing protein [Hymenobacter sp. J193]
MKTFAINRILLGFTFVLAGLQLSASTFYNGTITGTLRDGETNEPIPSATVAILRADDNAVIRTVATNADGSFQVGKVPFGKYKLATTVLGFKPQQPRILVNGVQTRIAVGNVLLQPLGARKAAKTTAAVTAPTCSTVQPQG